MVVTSFRTKLTHGTSQGQIKDFKKGELVHGDGAFLGGPILHTGGTGGGKRVHVSPPTQSAESSKKLLC